MGEIIEQSGRDGFSDNTLNEEYKMLMSAMQVSVSKHLLDEHFTMIWGNDFYYKLIRYPRAEYEEKFQNRPDAYYRYHHAEKELAELTEAVMGALRENRPEYRIIAKMPVKDGHIWVRVNGIFTKDPAADRVVVYTVITDITDLVEMQKMQSITFNNIPGFVAKFLIKDLRHIELLEANDQFHDFFGAPGDNGGYHQLLEYNLNLNRDAVYSQYDRLKNGGHIHFLAKLQNQRGGIAWMQVNGDCVDWIDGAPVYLLLYIDVTDLTDLREMQKKLEAQAQQLRDALAGAQKANAAKRDFLSRMSHEIRTPMNAIIGMTTIAAAHIGDEARVEDCLDKISFSSKHLLSLINDILDMSKIEGGKLSVSHEPFSLQRLLESVTTIIYPQAAAQGLDFSESVQNVMAEELVGDSMRVSQILLNLLSNAVKFTPAGGKVRLEVGQLPCRGGQVKLRFVVSDTGRGMSEQFLERLYQPFEQEPGVGATRFGGTGLGMSITKNLVSLLDGSISVRSKLNEGTTFTLELPFELAEGQQSGKYPALDSLRVLVSDNNVDDCTYTSLLLEKFGIAAKWALSGREAVEEIRRSLESGEHYDICLVDWKMPDMDGIETTRRIRTIVGPETLIIIITAYDYSGIEADAREAGANLFLAKPVFASSLYNTLLDATSLGRRLPKQRVSGTTALKGSNILLVEDNALNMEIAVELLKMAGARVSGARDGREAVDWFLSPEGRGCDAILMDIQMPGMNGEEAARLIRGCGRPNARSVPIIAMTANAFQEDVATALAAGMDAHIAKPIDTEVLYRTVSGLIERGRPRG